MTRAERDRLIADQHLTITLADGVCESAYSDAEDEFSYAARIRAAAEREADRKFEKIRDEAEAEIARLEGLEVTE